MAERQGAVAADAVPLQTVRFRDKPGTIHCAK